MQSVSRSSSSASPVVVDRLHGRTAEQLREHYDIEKQLAMRLRHAPREERHHGLYTAVYDELLRRIPHHPLLSQGQESSIRRVAAQHEILAPFLEPDTVFLEVGAGHCALSLALARQVRFVYAVDVSAELTSRITGPENFTLAISDGTSIPVPPGSIDLAFSNQLMEHLHPEDAAEQLQEIYKALAPGGTYVCFTPNRLSGPHDVSRGFDDVATGMHLHEYTVRELTELMRSVGFKRLQILLPVGHVMIPLTPIKALESALSALPTWACRAIAYRRTLRGFLGIRMVARK